MAQQPNTAQQQSDYPYQYLQGQQLPPNQIPYAQQGYQQPYYAAPQQTRGGMPGWIWVLIIVPLVLLCTCLGIGYFVTSAAKTAVQTAATAVVGDTGNGIIPGGKVGPATKVEPIQRPLASTPARSFTYANLRFTVKAATISNQVADNPPQFRTDAATLDMTLSVTNPTADAIRIEGGLLQITLGDGTALKQPVDMRVEAQDTQESKLSFSVAPATTWSKAQLSMNEVGKEPTILPLDGTAPAAQYPLKLADGSKASLTEPSADFTITHAALDLDAFGARAATGKRYLILAIHVASHAENGIGISTDSFRLKTGSTPVAPETISPIGEALYKDEAKDFQVAFVVPANAKSATLSIGEPDKENVDIALELTPATS